MSRTVHREVSELTKRWPSSERIAAQIQPDHMSSIYWAAVSHTASEHERLLQQSSADSGLPEAVWRRAADLRTAAARRGGREAGIANTAKICRRTRSAGWHLTTIRSGPTFHPHVGSLIENPRQIDMLMDQDGSPRYFSLARTRRVTGWAAAIRCHSLEVQAPNHLHACKDIRAYHRGLPGLHGQCYRVRPGCHRFPGVARILKREV